MGSFFVRIDENSIRENPDYGQTRTLIKGPHRIKFQAEKLPSFFENKKNCIVTNEDPELYVGEIWDPALRDRCINEKTKGITITEEMSPIPINHAPIPKYSFKYVDKEIECDCCAEKFRLSKLESASHNDMYSNTICPKCGEWDCVDIIYEDIKSALKKNPKIIFKSNEVMVDVFLVQYDLRYSQADHNQKLYHLDITDILFEGKSIQKALNNNFKTYKSSFRDKILDAVRKKEGDKIWSFLSIRSGLSGYYEE